MMSAVTYYVALPFKRGEDGEIVADIPRECPSPLSAIQVAGRLASNGIGAIAFSRSGDPATGEFSDAIVLQSFGEVLSLDEVVDTYR
jgi:hypothetical protein